jgi:hypothetical protein
LGNAQGPPISVYNDVDDCGPPIVSSNLKLGAS